LTSHRIQQQCLSGLERRIVPPGAVVLTRAGDIRKLGMHWVTLASDADGRGSVIDYDFWPFTGVEGRSAGDCELAILEGLWEWHAAQQEITYEDQAGEIFGVELTLIDAGWKEESWAGQPVHVFCSQLGPAFVGSKGVPHYQRPQASRKVIVGDNWHLAYPSGFPLVEMNADHWKLKVREAWLAERGSPGSLTLFAPFESESRNRHLGFAKHMTSEHYETRPAKGFRQMKTGWYQSGKPNHWFDALYGAFVARSIKGISALTAAAASAAPRPSTAASSPAPSRQQSHHPAPQPPPPTPSDSRATGRRRIVFRR